MMGMSSTCMCGGWLGESGSEGVLFCVAVSCMILWREGMWML